MPIVTLAQWRFSVERRHFQRGQAQTERALLRISHVWLHEQMARFFARSAKTHFTKPASHVAST
jgi:hypothetical protein